MYNLSLGETFGKSESISLSAIPQASNGSGSISICIRLNGCSSDLYFDLAIGCNTCPRKVTGALSQRFVNPVAAAAVTSYQEQIQLLIPEVAITWVTQTITATTINLVGILSGTTCVSGSIYGNANTTVTFNYTNPAISVANTYQPGSPFLLNLPPVTAVAASTGANQVVSGTINSSAIACPAPVAAGVNPCPDYLQTFPNFVGVVSNTTCGSEVEVITSGFVKIKTGAATVPNLYIGTGVALPYLYINTTTRQFEIKYLPYSAYIYGVSGLHTIGQIQTLEVTPFTAIIKL